ncbi:streptophobe family protein [Saccharothrix luteola]|uniref:streptophobe family protein n=1 Tax=Saccharothrix luteola TaxID=2893018 RepID=UPI001E427004|nr:streptophobe family protein [Saccharothrix luteola]MCC8246254.1 streptophobe family protein [Saccharothrix luteola]
MVTPREVCRGVVASVAALAAMVGVAAAGLLLLDADRIGGFGGLTAAVVALAVGGSVEFSAAADLPFAVRGGVTVAPLGVSLVGAVVLAWLLLRRRDGLLGRGAAAVVAFPAGVAAVAWAARGTVALPGGATGGGSGASACGVPAAGPFGRGGSVDALGAGFAVPVWPAVAGAVGWVLAVVGVCWLVTRFRVAVRGVVWTTIALTVVCLLVAWVFSGAAAAGAVLLGLPLVVFGALSLGLGVPWTVTSDGALSCVLDAVGPPTPGGPLTWVAVAVLLGLGALVARSGGRDGGPLRRAARVSVWLAAVVGAALGGSAVLSRVTVELGVVAFGFTLPVLEARLAADPLVALGLGLAAGAAAGFSGSLLVDLRARFRSADQTTR